ncbi:MAG: anaerobic ribonucleoside-triphosphate reductase activating protein [Lachnospiraceae bacterium]|nr:anaerobic ribonucleoside-triphosphate reductase activating protein [Lachnospiraceae bacterium]
MNYADIKKLDIANGPGIRVSVFVSGCTHHCKGCFNEEAWDFKYGKPFTDDTIEEVIEAMKPDYIYGLSLLGGEPMEPANQAALLPLVRRVREVYPQKTVWCYSGYLFDRDLLGRFAGHVPETEELLSMIDVLVDGEFVEDLKDLSLWYKGSSNQRVILVQESLAADEVVLWTPPEELPDKNRA